MKKVIITSFITLLLLSSFIFVKFYNSVINYDRSIYSVVVFNKTNETLNNITIFYGNDINDNDSVVKCGQIDNLQPKEHRKINISTLSPSEKASIPYNVWVETVYEGEKKNFTAGYFGKSTGGLAYFELSVYDGKLFVKRIFSHEKSYKKVFRRNQRKQTELSW